MPESVGHSRAGLGCVAIDKIPSFSINLPRREDPRIGKHGLKSYVGSPDDLCHVMRINCEA